MNIQHVQQWVIEDFTPAEAQMLRRLGWQWMDGNIDARYPLRYGHFFTFSTKVLSVTTEKMKGVKVGEMQTA